MLIFINFSKLIMRGEKDTIFRNQHLLSDYYVAGIVLNIVSKSKSFVK
jgi:hypothetical protein